MEELTEQEAIDSSILHWERMIACAQMQPQNDIASFFVMKQLIGEAWAIKDCALCKKYFDWIREICGMCPIIVKDTGCDEDGSKWRKVNECDLKTWGEWLIAAYEMLEMLQSLKINKDGK